MTAIWTFAVECVRTSVMASLGVCLLVALAAGVALFMEIVWPK